MKPQQPLLNIKTAKPENRSSMLHFQLKRAITASLSIHSVYCSQQKCWSGVYTTWISYVRKCLLVLFQQFEEVGDDWSDILIGPWSTFTCTIYCAIYCFCHIDLFPSSIAVPRSDSFNKQFYKSWAGHNRRSIFKWCTLEFRLDGTKINGGNEASC